jgi:tol-pal system protein YbgF
MVKKTVLSLIIATALITGCAGPAKQLDTEGLLPEIDVIQVKENSDEALKLAQEAKLDVEVLTARLNEIDSKIIMLSEEISSVSGAKIEELESRLALLVEAYKDLAAQVKALEMKSLGSGRKSSSPGPTFSPSSAVSIITSPEHELYQKGLQVFNTRQYDNAMKIFNDVLQQYPSGKYPDNCHYWIGECLYAKGDFTGAITSFQKVLSYQNSGKADDAQIKIGLCYLKMGQTGAAKDEFKKLKDRYPASEYVPRAEKYLSDLK